MYNKKLQSFLRDYFTLTSRERGGALSLASIIILQLGILFWLNFRPPAPFPAVEKHALLLKKFDARQPQHPAAADVQNEPAVQKLFPFDPNTATDEQWQQLGMSVRQTSVIRNYLNKGGRFRKKEDVSKMYVVSEIQYQKLEPFIQITSDTTPLRHPAKEIRKEKKIQIIDINTADTLQLTTLPLVGAGRARMIFKYREALGGFYHERQLYEVFSIDTPVVEAIRPHLIIDTEKIRRLDLNTDSIRHPYLTRKQVMILSSYRKQHGNYRSLEDVKKVTVLSDETISKLAPYLVFE